MFLDISSSSAFAHKAEFSSGAFRVTFCKMVWTGWNSWTVTRVKDTFLPDPTLSHTLWVENLTSVEAYECADILKVSRRFSFLDEKRREGGGLNLQSCIPPRLRVQKLRHRTSFPSDVDLHSTKNSCNPNRDVQKTEAEQVGFNHSPWHVPVSPTSEHIK